MVIPPSTVVVALEVSERRCNQESLAVEEYGDYIPVRVVVEPEALPCDPLPCRHERFPRREYDRGKHTCDDARDVQVLAPPPFGNLAVRPGLVALLPFVAGAPKARRTSSLVASASRSSPRPATNAEHPAEAVPAATSTGQIHLIAVALTVMAFLSPGHGVNCSDDQERRIR